MANESFLLENCRSLGIELSDKQLGQFMQYYAYLAEKNKVMNLTAITDYEEVVIKHFTDSLSVIKVLPELADSSLQVLDLGSGAGFPGIPLKIAFPSLDIVMLDSLQKRVGFMNEVILLCGLERIKAVHGRAEDLSAKGKEYRENFDICVSRAVANLATLSEYCLPFVKVGGKFVSYKSSDIDEEYKAAQNAIGILGGKAKTPYRFYLHGDQGRSLVVIDKIKSTPQKYPRKSGTPAREPLK